jgi:Predicted nucleotide-binding protein containing TIR -like domain
MAKRYKTYYNREEDEEMEFTVFIIHGRSTELGELESYINNELGFKTIVMKNDFSGKIILDKFRDLIWDDTDCAIALMSPDDMTHGGNFRARQNVFYELGYCQAVFDGFYDEEYENEPIIVIKERSIDFKDVSDLLGLEYLEYTESHLSEVFVTLSKHLKKLYKEIREFNED